MPKLKDLFNVPKDYQVNNAMKRYFGSLVPPLKVLEKLEEVHYEISLDVPRTETDILLPENPVNNHLFKPRFYSSEEGHIKVVAPCKEVVAHSLRGLAVFAHIIDRKDIQVSIIDKRTPIQRYCSYWKLAERVIICQIESFLKFLRVFRLLKIGAHREEVNSLIWELENRFKLQNQNLVRETERKIERRFGITASFEKEFAIYVQPTTTPLVHCVSIKYKGIEISLVQLPWGESLSEELIETLIKMNPNIKIIGSVGGIAYWGQDRLSLDDALLPTAAVVFNTGHEPIVKPFENIALMAPKNRFFIKKFVLGQMTTVVPKFNVLSNTEPIKSHLGNIVNGVDNEFGGFRRALEKAPNIKHGAVHYIMDMPISGITLGDTYYYKPYLEQLFMSPNRGKYFCFERLLNCLTSLKENRA